MARREKKSTEAYAFERGYIVALSNIVVAHGLDVEIVEALWALGSVPWSRIDEYDRKVLRKHIATVNRMRREARSKQKGRA